ncbi:16S rRNA (uracil(1498)-N(3))-methyltransferase [Staphylococcus canis]|uniref:Ribosomal RNA small subunit methyltransferase E n=1 Tax=Staphylococcus canis TaxID=2724942 RepID=A0ABS0TBG9_9STAP|nr:16S rRNA (uracil(1498)-N(3))-methyltransferase [Staphylococcus canis]MBI5975757.1 16S rRNA (uracil(1498)-N(3))-methyltransferase [Staphylococcus canis]
MQRYFLNENAEINQRFFITDKSDVHHINNVMRLSKDDNIVVNFLNKTYKSKILNVNDQIEIETIEALEINTEFPIKITLCSGLIKADKYEWLLQKATELGASHFIATQMDRSIVKLTEAKVHKKIDRWQKIVKEAAEQSYRQIIPDIKYISNLDAIYDMINEYDYVLIAYEETAKKGEKSNFKHILQNVKKDSQILMIFGPEGGFSEEEIHLFNDKATYIGLGPRILRAETAPLYALSALSYEIDLMR